MTPVNSVNIKSDRYYVVRTIVVRSGIVLVVISKYVDFMFRLGHRRFLFSILSGLTLSISGYGFVGGPRPPSPPLSTHAEQPSVPNLDTGDNLFICYVITIITAIRNVKQNSKQQNITSYLLPIKNVIITN